MKRRLLLCALCLVLAASASAQDVHKYALSMFHFNVQYVAGGMVGFLPVVLPGWEQSQEENEDMIIVESFEPVLDLYLAHPEWGVNLEMQAYMIEVMGERHRHVLDKLRTLAERGQAEITCFHYSDQLFLAYPRQDWEKTQELTRAIFEKYDLPLGKAVFCQEGQAGVGMAPAMKEKGYEVMVWPGNLFRYNLGDDVTYQPLYEFGDIHMVVGGKGVNYSDAERSINVTWTFHGDGELLATGDLDPYFPPIFKVNSTAVREYEEKLENLEANGYDIATVSQYVNDLKEVEFEPFEQPQLLDGTWQPQSHTFFRWLGAAGIWGPDERDNHVRTLGAVAHREFMAAETALDEAESRGHDVEYLRKRLDEAWRLLMLGQVTDATGINPFKGEVHYGLSHMGEALRVAHEVTENALSKLGDGDFLLNTETGKVTRPDPPPEYPEVDPVWDIEIDAPTRNVTETWVRVSDEPAVYRVDLKFTAGENKDGRHLRARFAGTGSKIIYCPGLLDREPVEYTRAGVAWTEYPMALANGMINLADDLFVIKDQGFTHIAANIFPKDADVEFMDDTATWFEEVHWRFYLVFGTVDEAVDVANRINVTPTLVRTAVEEGR